MKRILSIGVVAAVASVVWVGNAEAGSISCPAPQVDSGHVMTITTAVNAVCFAFGHGNINGSNDFINQQGYLTIDKDDGPNADNNFTYTVGGDSFGTFTLDNSWWSTYTTILLGLKVGNNLTVTWAAFSLAPGTTTGTWSVAPLNGAGMSHMNLYGCIEASDTCDEIPIPDPQCTEDCGPEVPEPASLVLLGVGLAMTAFGLRRRAVKA